MVRVMLTPIPAGLITDNGVPSLKVNVLVSLKPGADRNDSEPLRLDEINYLKFAKWIKELAGHISLKMIPDANSQVQVKEFVSCTQGIYKQRTEQEIHSHWITLFEKDVYQTFQDNLGDRRFERTLLQKLKKTNADSLNEINNALAEKIPQQKNLKVKYQSYLTRQKRLDTFSSELDKDTQADKNELDSFGKNLNDEAHKKDLDDYQSRGKNLKDREIKGMAVCKQQLDQITGEIASLQVSLMQRNDLDAELKRTTASGILKINNTDLKKITDSITNIQATINNSPDDAKKLQQPSTPNLENNYTSNINSSRIIYYTDVAGYFFNYPLALYDLGIMHAFQMPVDPAMINKITGEGGTIAISVSHKTDTADFSYLTDSKHTKGVTYQIFPYSFQTRRSLHFMPRPKNPQADQTQSLFSGGFLNLKATDVNKNRRFVLKQNNPQQMKFQQADIEKGQFNDHTKGFYLIKLEAVDPNESSDKDDDHPLYLEDLLVGYRVDVRRQIPNAPKSLKTNWKSLHARSGNITLKNKTIPVNDEGWISKDSLVQVKKKVFVSPRGAAVINKQAVNIIHMDLGDYTVLDDSDNPTQQVITLADHDQDNSHKNTSAKYIVNVTKYINQTPQQLNTNLDQLNDELLSWNMGIKRMACNDHGEFFFDVYVDNGQHVSAASFLPTSVVCYINGLSLNAPVIMSSTLKEEYDQMAKKGSQAVSNNEGLVGYLAKCDIKISEMEAVKRSLPALRINDIYQVRCRLVCLDGTSLPPGTDTEALDYSLQNLFLRQDNIPSPILLSLTKRYKYIGESPFKAIVCSDEGASESVRYILPPAGSWQLAEWSKAMDGPDYLPDDEKIDRYANNYAPVFEKSTVTGEETTYIQVGKHGKVPETFDPDDTYIHYIPDPAALFFRLIPTYRNKKKLLMDFGNYKTLVLPFYQKNQYGPENVIIYKLTVRAAGKNSPSGFKFGGKVKNVQEILLWMHRTDDIEFLVRSMPFGDFANTAQFQHYYSTPDILKKVDFMSNKPYPVFFGDQKMVAIHANAEPAGYPWFIGENLKDESRMVTASRKGILPTQLQISGNLFFPGATCDELELYGEWVDAIDDPSNNEPLRFNTVTKKLHDFFDSDRGAILQSMSKANPDLENDPEAKNTANKRIIYDDINYHFDLVHDVPDAKHRIIRYWLVSRNRFLKLLTKDKKGVHIIDQNNPKERSRYYPLRVPSGLSPDIPKIAYVLPVFRWQHKNGHNHIRSGDTIRVYFKRPWFSSGIGEQVAVILSPPNPKKDDYTIIVPYCSAWGSDHINGNAGLAKLSLKDLTNAQTFDLTGNYLNINNELFAGTKAKLFDYALFDVHFSDQKKLWYADITFQLPRLSYCPFVKLSIARFQQYAEEGMHFSDAVSTDFIQLYPDRQVTVKKGLNGIISIEVLPSLIAKQAANNNEWQTREIPEKPNVIRAAFFKTDTTEDFGDIFFQEDKILLTQDLLRNEVTNNYSCQVDKFKSGEKLLLLLREYEDFSVGAFDESKLRLVLTDTIHSDNFIS